MAQDSRATRKCIPKRYSGLHFKEGATLGDLSSLSGVILKVQDKAGKDFWEKA